MKRYFHLLCAPLALCLLLCGCAHNQTPPEPEASAAPQEEDTVICTIGGESLYRSDFQPIFEYYYSLYSTYYGADFSNEELLKSLQDEVFNTLVETEVIRQRVAAEGLTLDADEQQAVEETFQSTYASLIASFEAQAQSEGAGDASARALELLEAELAANGKTLEQYTADLRADIEQSRLAQKLRQSVYDTVTLSEEDVRARFEAELAEQQEAFTADPAAFNAAQSNYESAGGAPPLYTPEGFRRVKHILVKITEARDEEEALTLANELYARAAEGGEDFDALMAEYGEDPGMQAEPNKSLGYLTYAQTNFVPEFLETAMALAQEGEIAQPVKTAHGYHVIKLEALLQSGPAAFEDVREAYRESLLAAMQQEAFAAKVEEWVEAAEIKSFIGRIRDLGKVEE